MTPAKAETRGPAAHLNVAPVANEARTGDIGTSDNGEYRSISYFSLLEFHKFVHLWDIKEENNSLLC